VAESFFSTLKAELTNGVYFATLVDAEAAIKKYVENFYNPVRRHSYLNYSSPIEFELKSWIRSIGRPSAKSGQLHRSTQR